MLEKVIPIRPAAASANGALRAAVKAPRYTGEGFADTLGRGLRDLRISVTDRCNFRCVYCMPRDVFDENYKFLPQSSLLSFEEIATLARVFVGLGVEKIRLTGGEPLVRRDLERLIALLAGLDVDLTLTTNGSLLAKKAQALKDAGLKRITVSLDSLDDVDLQGDERRRFPGGQGARRHRRGRRGRSAGQGQHGRQARPERPPGHRHGAPFPRQRAHRALHRIHGRRQHQWLAHGRRDPVSARSCAASRPNFRSNRSTRTTAAKSPSAGATRTAPAKSA